MSRILILAGPSGSGKTVASGRLCALPNFTKVITATTRSPRGAEVHGKDYLFFSEREFLAKAKNEEFLEYVPVHGNYYGTLKASVKDALASGKTPVLIVDVQGAEVLRMSDLPTVSIFLSPPEPWRETIRARMLKRGTDTESIICTRLQNAEFEMSRRHQFDHVVITDTIEDTVEKIKACLR